MRREIKTSMYRGGGCGRLPGVARLAGGAGLLLLSWSAAGAGIDVPAGSLLDFGSGYVDFSCGGIAVNGNVSGGTASLVGINDLTIGRTGTLTGGAGTYVISGNWTNSGDFQAGASTVQFTDGCSPTTTVSGNSTFYNLTFSTTSGKTFLLAAGSSQTVTNSLVLQGSSPQQPLVLQSTDPAVSAYVSPLSGATVTRTNTQVTGNANIGQMPIPTLSFTALLLLALLTLAAGIFGLRRTEHLRA